MTAQTNAQIAQAKARTKARTKARAEAKTAAKIAAARINARFTGEDARRFKELQLKTRQSASAVLREAVRRYHSQEVKPRRSAYEIMMESGLIGAFEGPEDLSTNKDKYLTEALRKKYPHHFEDEEPR